MGMNHNTAIVLTSFIVILGDRVITGHASARCIFIDHGDKNRTNYAKNECLKNDICRKRFKVAVIDLLPFSNYHYLYTIINALKACCGKCARNNYKVVKRYQNITEVNPSALKQFDVILPFMASTTQVDLFGQYFIPFTELTDAIYITEKKGSSLFNSILQLYPLVIACILLAVVGGFVEWILETSSNEEEFSRGFLNGWFEGIWWSFVTMTTVGYGDKTPKTFVGRLFAIIWILIGLITWGILTATLTTEIIKGNSPPPPNLKGAKVGSLEYRDYEQLIIANEGGIRIAADGWDFHSELLLLVDKLQNKEIQGILMDRFTSQYSTWFFNHKKKKNYSSYSMTPDFVKDKIDYFLNKTMRTELSFRTEKLAYGILMKSREDYEYFNPFFRDNRLRTNIGERSWMSTWIQHDKKNVSYYNNSMNMLFSPTNIYFKTFLIVVASVLLFIGVFGFIYKKRGFDQYSPKTKQKATEIGGENKGHES